MLQERNQLPIDWGFHTQVRQESNLIQSQKTLLEETMQEAQDPTISSPNWLVIQDEAPSPEILKSDQVEKSNLPSVPQDDEEKNLNDIRAGFEEQDQIKAAWGLKKFLTREYINVYNSAMAANPKTGEYYEDGKTRLSALNKISEIAGYNKKVTTIKIDMPFQRLPVNKLLNLPT